MRSTPKIIVDTGVVVEHLAGARHPSVLRLALSRMLCYTTVFQAAEVMAMAGSAQERGAVMDALAPMKVLGLNAKSAPRVAGLLRRSGARDRHLVLIAVVCLESRLPILTGRAKAFSGFPGLTCVSPGLVRKSALGREILRAARRRH